VAQALRPRLQFVYQRHPRSQPDAVFCTLWGGDLVAFIKQAKPFGLFDKMKWIIATGADITVTKALGNEMPNGLIVDQRYYFHWRRHRATRNL